MGSNIEIKARVKNLVRLKQVAEELSDTPCEVLYQEDTFFCTTKGRLKLRKFSVHSGELIYYERTDLMGPKQSDYRISKTDEPELLKAVLANALGIQVVVSKKRHLYKVGQTRIHIDEVERLGSFIELEFVMRPEQNPNEGVAITRELMKKLEIADEDLIAIAYADLLLNSTT